MSELCERCRRPAPAWESNEYAEWEATADGRVICPGCLTGEEESEMAEDMREVGDEMTGYWAPGLKAGRDRKLEARDSEARYREALLGAAYDCQSRF